MLMLPEQPGASVLVAWFCVFKINWRCLVGFAAALSLSACQHSTRIETDTTPDALLKEQWLTDQSRFEAIRKNTAALTNWQYSAKIAISTHQVREQANMVWRFHDQSNQVRLFGPFGTGQIKIDFDQYGVVLSDNKGMLHKGNSASRLLSEIVGWPIPVEALSWWLFAVPLEYFAARYKLNENQQISQLEQLGWEITFSNYRRFSNASGLTTSDQGRILPRKITAIKAGDGSAQTISIKIVSKSWQW